MSAGIVIAVLAAAFGIFYVAGGGIEKAKAFLKTTEDTDKKPAVEGGSQPARSDASQDQMPLTDKERQTSEIIKKINIGDEQEYFARPDDLPNNKTDLSKYDNYGTQTINAQQASATLAKEQQKSAQTKRELAIPNEIKYSTSLEGSIPTTGVQLKRTEPVVITNAKSQGGTSALQQKIILEQERAEALSLALYGDIHNPKQTPVKTVATNTVATKASTSTVNSALAAAQARGATSANAKQLLAQAQAKKK